MSIGQKSENAVITLSSTAKAATFATGVRKVYLTTTTDCYVSFDENVATTSSFLLKANEHPADFDFGDGGPVKVWAIGTSGTLYILVIR